MTPRSQTMRDEIHTELVEALSFIANRIFKIFPPQSRDIIDKYEALCPASASLEDLNGWLSMVLFTAVISQTMSGHPI